MGISASYSSASERMFAIGWVGMALIMSLTVATTDVFGFPLQTVYVFAAGLTLREVLGVAAWALRD